MFSLTIRHSRQGLVAAFAAAALLLASVAPAFAQDDSTGLGYTEQGGQVQEQVQSGVGAVQEDNTGTGGGNGDNGSNGSNGSSPTASDSSSGTLPFTGLETGLILTAGAALAGLGLGLRRVARESS